tara:strand:- start:3093 stop:3602 length:510 start_codon:yes stop_codon:yes gene_type:complete
MTDRVLMFESHVESIHDLNLVKKEASILIGYCCDPSDEMGEILSGNREGIDFVPQRNLLIKKSDCDVSKSVFTLDQKTFELFSVASMENQFGTWFSDKMCGHDNMSSGDEGRGHSLIEGNSGHVKVARPPLHHIRVPFSGILFEYIWKTSWWGECRLRKRDDFRGRTRG